MNNNISLKIRPRNDRNRFIPSETVTLEEFVYFDSMINQDKNLVLDIIDSLIEYLSTGEYVDKSGLAKKNYSPDLQTISQQRVQQTLQRKDNEDYINLTHMGESKKYKNNQINCNKNMNRNRKNVVRLTESKLREMIKESVRQTLNEVGNTRKGQNLLGQLSMRQHLNGDDYGSLQTTVYARDNRSDINHASSFIKGEEEYYNQHVTNQNRAKAQAIIADLQRLNFEERGHEIREYSDEIAVTNINVPAMADCKMIAKKHDVEFYMERSSGLGVFEL